MPAESTSQTAPAGTASLPSALRLRTLIAGLLCLLPLLRQLPESLAPELGVAALAIAGPKNMLIAALAASLVFSNPHWSE